MINKYVHIGRMNTQEDIGAAQEVLIGLNTEWEKYLERYSERLPVKFKKIISDTVTTNVILIELLNDLKETSDKKSFIEKAGKYADTFYKVVRFLGELHDVAEEIGVDLF